MTAHSVQDANKEPLTVGAARGKDENHGGAENALFVPNQAPGVKTSPQRMAALKYVVGGWRVFPCGVDKKPLTPNGFKDATTDPEQIKAWWAKWPGASIGCPTGPDMGKSGAWVLDVDLPEGPATLAELEATYGLLPTTVEQQTGSGGRQLFFKWPEGREVKNSARKIGPGLDVRGAGGYVILPPSGHPSGGIYSWGSNGAILAFAPDWLLDLVAPLPTPEAPKPTRTKQDKSPGTTPYGRKALENEAAKVASATQGGRNQALNQSAFVLAQLVAGGELDRAEAEAALLDAAGHCGLSEGEARQTIGSGFKAGAREPRQAPELDARVNASRGEDCLPVPFDDHFPQPIAPELIPGILRDFPLALAEAKQVPFELALCNALGALAVAMQRKVRIQVREGYFEPLNMYGLCPLPPGERKSATVDACKRPLVEWQTAKRQEMAEVIREAESTRKTLEKAIESKRARAANAATPEDRQDMVREILAMEKDLPEIPISPRLLADDFTPEALGALMERHEQRIGVLEAEGGLFDILAGRYSSGVPNLDAVLKSWGGEPCQIDRKGHGPIFLDSPHLSLVISPQPEIVQGLAQKPGFRGRGLIGRFIYFMPQSRLGSRKTKSNPIPLMVSEAWRQKLHQLLALPWAVDENGDKTSFVVHLDPAAYADWEKFADAVEVELRPDGDFGTMTDWAGKFPGQAVRLAGLFHAATVDAPYLANISPEIMRAALDVAAILAEHAKAAYGLMGSDPAQECAKAILRWIIRDRKEQFTGREALRVVRGRFPTMEKVNPGLTLLEERAYIFQAQTDNPGRGRKPSQGYSVNPKVWRV
jgi:hypothetical protein